MWAYFFAKSTKKNDGMEKFTYFCSQLFDIYL